MEQSLEYEAAAAKASAELRTVLETNFKFPFRLHDYQIDTVMRALVTEFGYMNGGGVVESLRAGAVTRVLSGSRGTVSGILFPDKVGLGKSSIAMAFALMQSLLGGVEQILALMPPILIDQFADFVKQIGGIDKPLIYRGTPAQRGKMMLDRYPIVIMSYNIFRSDADKIKKWAGKNKLCIIADELSLKSSNKTYKCLKELIYGKLKINPAIDAPRHKFCALNATPVSDRGQVYWWCSIFNPSKYISKKLFDITHAGKVDHWGNVISWHNTELMDEAFNSFCVESRNVDLELPEGTYIEQPYQLEKKHAELYRDIADAEFQKLPEDMVELAIEAFFSTLQRVILTPKDYGLDIRSPILDIIDSKLDQMNEEDRLIIYTRHVSVSKMLAENYKQAVAVFGGVSKKEEKITAFKSGEAQIMIANMDSLSKGANLQVANHTLFAELPFRSDMFLQCCGRTLRQGQKRACSFHIPLAAGTIQRQIYKRLLDNDADLLNFNRGKSALRDFIKQV